ncbi:hypothetical protein [Peribacillus sp. SCS-155]|uniref:hypothetical protein n=1 Tax=Peribacillus sedimenti TaxID=3115297 RepID=UPI00390697A8
MFKQLLIAGMLISGGLLAGCSSDDAASGSSESKEEAKPSEQKAKDSVPEPKKDENGNTILEEPGQKAESEEATAELLNIKKVNETVNIKPIKVTIQDIKLIKLTDVSNDYALNVSMGSQIDSEVLEKGFSYIQVKYTAENTEDRNIEWYDLMNVVTDKGEQIDGQMVDFITDEGDTDSEFIGKVKKEFVDGFVVKNADINKVKLVFGSSVDSSTYEDITGEQTVEYSFE